MKKTNKDENKEFAKLLKYAIIDFKNGNYTECSNCIRDAVKILKKRKNVQDRNKW